MYCNEVEIANKDIYDDFNFKKPLVSMAYTAR